VVYETGFRGYQAAVSWVMLTGIEVAESVLYHPADALELLRKRLYSMAMSTTGLVTIVLTNIFSNNIDIYYLSDTVPL
jgi:hypothetical protein